MAPESHHFADAPMRGTLFIVAAPSGAGKSSIVNACLAEDPDIALSISFTSRLARPGVWPSWSAGSEFAATRDRSAAERK